MKIYFIGQILSLMTILSMEIKFEKYDDKNDIPWWIVKCSEEIEKTFKLDLDIEDSFCYILL